MTISTNNDNISAQDLYESLGATNSVISSLEGLTEEEKAPFYHNHQLGFTITDLGEVSEEEEEVTHEFIQ